MYLIRPRHPGATDALTGHPLAPDGVLRQVLLPADHYASRVGDISIHPASMTPPQQPAAQAAKPAKAKADKPPQD